LVGPVTVSALRGLHVDQLFMGVHGMSERAGFTTPNLLEAETNRAFLASSEQLVVLADHTKWGMLGLCTIASLDEADLVISDNRLSGEGQESLSAKVGRLLVVDVRGSGEVSSADELSTS
jgi:DeoR/GlpR family transcriptional regulator of sugar metabolism